MPPLIDRWNRFVMKLTESRKHALREEFARSHATRAHDRLNLEIPVSVEILIPEETFRPHQLTGATLNVSLKGMQLMLDLLEASVYSKMLISQRMARVTIANPRSGNELKLTGRIAWIDFRNEKAGGTSGACFLGIRFSEKDDGTNLSQYSRFVEDVGVMLRKSAED